MRIVLIGVPMAKQSARFFKRGSFMQSYQPSKITNWVAQARAQIVQTLPADWNPINTPVHITKLTFVFPVISSLKKSEKAELETAGYLAKPTRPDCDNLMKQTFDACNGLVWKDDSQIWKIDNVTKVMGAQPRVEMYIEGC